jgi:hypothetical protein
VESNRVSEIFRLSYFLVNRLIDGEVVASRAKELYSPGRFLVLISVRG